MNDERVQIGQKFLAENGWGAAKRSFIQGDASSRKYERLSLDGKKALFVDSPAKSDGPILAGGKSYSEIAHIAETVSPFVAIDHYLEECGFTVPKIHAADLGNGFLILEDLGTEVYAEKIKNGDDMDTPYVEAINVLVKMATLERQQELIETEQIRYQIPFFDQNAFTIEAGLFADWFWKWLGITLPSHAQESFNDIWKNLYIQLPQDERILALRDYHSPNILWCEEREGMRRAGLIDFQDAVMTHPAYDLVSLLQDARTDIPAEVEEEYRKLYISKRSERSEQFDEEKFYLSYAILGAQRNTKILGIFARLALRDNKPHYLKHIPRVLGYLERCLNAPGLETIKAWYETYLPGELRGEICAQLTKADIGARAIVLSAGLGKRMAPLSNICPKPLIKVHNKPLLEYSLDKLTQIGTSKIVVNVHYLADQIEQYLEDVWRDRQMCPDIVVSDERAELLETGGGIKKALPELGIDPFFVLNSDSFWLEDKTQNLVKLIETWDDQEMDCLILLASKNTALGYAGKGDFDIHPDGRLKRRSDEGAPYVVSGTYLVHPRLFEGSPKGAFSMNILWNKALEEGRLFGAELEGKWLHIGTPQAVEDAEKYISESEFGLS